MALDWEKVLMEQLTHGCELMSRLEASLGEGTRGDGSRAREVAKELSRVLSASLCILKASNSLADATMEAGKRGAHCSGSDASVCKRPRMTGGEQRKGPRKECTMKTSITASAYHDGYRWRKYGQKKIQNSEFLRNYYRCAYSHDNNCTATKQVQQLDKSNPPLFRVTSINEHTCRAVVNTASSANCTPQVVDTSKTDSLLFRANKMEDDAIISCLATVIRGCNAGNLDCPQSTRCFVNDISESVLTAQPSPGNMTFVSPSPPNLDGHEKDDMAMDSSSLYDQLDSFLMGEQNSNYIHSANRFLPQPDEFEVNGSAGDPTLFGSCNVEIL